MDYQYQLMQYSDFLVLPLHQRLLIALLYDCYSLCHWMDLQTMFNSNFEVCGIFTDPSTPGGRGGGKQYQLWHGANYDLFAIIVWPYINNNCLQLNLNLSHATNSFLSYIIAFPPIEEMSLQFSNHCILFGDRPTIFIAFHHQWL